MIAAIAAVKNEADIIEATVRHMFAQGVESMRISDGMSTDGTTDILMALKSEFSGRDSSHHLEVIFDRSPIFYQPKVMTQLASDMGRRFYNVLNWVVPFDADEFIVTHSGRPFAEVLQDHVATPGDKVFIPTFLHLDWDRKVQPLHRWPKVAFRWFPYGHDEGWVRDPGLTMGNHDVYGGKFLENSMVHPDIHIRELQFRSFEHYCSKVALNLQTLDRSLPADHAAHYRALEGMDRKALEEQWQLYQSQPTVVDPVPSSFRHLIG